MKFKDVIGIDVSKLTLDVHLHSTEQFQVFENAKPGYKKLLTWVKKHAASPLDQLLFCFEHTGLYSSSLALFLASQDLQFTIVPGLEIKRSLGIQRGKDDKVDAKRIALYAYEKRDKLHAYSLPEKSIIKLGQLLSLREKLVKQCAGYKAALKEQSQFLNKSDNRLLFSIPTKLIREIGKQIERVEEEIDFIINENLKLKEQMSLITSIPGVGRQTALQLMVVTNAFSSFENPRKLASYAGIAPFPHRSGTSIKGRTKVSSLANKKIKSLLSVCALSAIQHDAEIKKYYKRRIELGKNKMSTINAVRNKLIFRIFAVVKRGTPFVNTCAYAA